MPDVMATLLCGVLDGLLEEPDDTIKPGRILIAAMVVKVYSNMALWSMIDFGFVDIFRSIQEKEKSKAFHHLNLQYQQSIHAYINQSKKLFFWTLTNSDIVERSK
jgi:hypothetical protein